MAMLVETYECEEVAEETPEMNSEAIGIIEQLGLTGQQALLKMKKREAGETTERCPYREMKPDENFVYRVLCPNKVHIKDFSSDSIPVRALQIAAHALEYFEALEVWYAASSLEKDPVLVGRKKHPTVTYTDQFFILARWGEHLDEMPALLNRAFAQWKATMLSGLQAVASSAAADILKIERLSSPAAAIGMKVTEAPYYLGL